MNLPVILTKTANIAKNLCGNGLLIAKKHAPELLIGGGLVGFGLTIFETVKATNKTNEILEEKNRRSSVYAEALDYPIGYGPDEYENDISDLNRRTKIAIIKAWLPVGTLAVASGASILCGYKIINGRYVATAAAYKGLENFIGRYRGNVTERFGKDVDWELANDVKADTLEKAMKEREENRKIDEENKGKKIGKKRHKTAYQDIYCGIFDNYSDRWQRYWTAEQVLEYLKFKQNQLNDMLRVRKHVFVNEVYDMLGLERTTAGAVNGWILTRTNPDSHISLGIDEMPADELRAILSTHRNDDIRVKIRLNPDGLIYNMIEDPNPVLI